ncbi:GIMAP4 [Symbiodinium microadriaticum]|nr:GIMAP4 [Symbiodinium microadriaticum]
MTVSAICIGAQQGPNRSLPRVLFDVSLPAWLCARRAFGTMAAAKSWFRPVLFILRGVMAMANEVINVLSVGRTGHGKSQSLNVLADRDIFQVGHGFDSQTATSAVKSFERDGYRFNACDTPGLYDTGVSLNDTLKELTNVAFLRPEGYHVVLLQLDDGRFTKESELTLAFIEKTAGFAVYKHMILTIKNGQKMSKEQWVEKAQSGPKKLAELVKAVENRVVPIDISSPGQCQRSGEALRAEVIRLTKEHHFRTYTNEHFQEAGRRLKSIMQAVDPETKAKHEWEQWWAAMKVRLEKEKEAAIQAGSDAAESLRSEYEWKMADMERRLEEAKQQQQVWAATHFQGGATSEGGSDPLLGFVGGAVGVLAAAASGCQIS